MIIFTRHYLTEFNTKDLIQTYTNNSIIELKDTFTYINQWKGLLPENFNPSQIWCSTLIRTEETCKLLGYTPTNYSYKLNELSLFEYEGKNYLALNDHYLPTDLFKRTLFEKMIDLKFFLNSLNKGEDILIFTHGITIRLIYCILMNESIPEYFPDIFNIVVGNLGQLQIGDTIEIKNIMEN